MSIKLFISGMESINKEDAIRMWYTDVDQPVNDEGLALPPNPHILYALYIPIIWFWLGEELPDAFDKTKFMEFELPSPMEIAEILGYRLVEGKWIKESQPNPTTG